MYVNVSIVRWIVSYLHQAPNVYVPTAVVIDAALAAGGVTLLGPYTSTSPNIEAVKAWYMVYVPPPFVNLLLGQTLTLVQVWMRVQGLIVDRGLEADCKPLIDWLHVALTQKGDPINPSPLKVDLLTAPFFDDPLLSHRHNFLLRHLPGLDPSIQRVTGTQIATNIGEVSVELQRD